MSAGDDVERPCEANNSVTVLKQAGSGHTRTGDANFAVAYHNLFNDGFDDFALVRQPLCQGRGVTGTAVTMGGGSLYLKNPCFSVVICA